MLHTWPASPLALVLSSRFDVKPSSPPFPPFLSLPPELRISYNTAQLLEPASVLDLSSTRLSAIASAAALRNLSASSAPAPFEPDPLPAPAPAVVVVVALSLRSFSSSLSPRLKGSLSVIGLGSTADSGCHLLCLLPGGVAVSRAPSFGDELYASISSVSSLKATLRPSLGLGDLDGGGGLNKLGFARGLGSRMGAIRTS